ncbi:MAG: DNA topoisomerase I [Candidatus Bathyarchaeia archaeon]
MSAMTKYTLIVTEKPDAARRIAQALDAKQKPKRAEINHVPYYIANLDRQIVVVPAIGHLYTVAAETRGRNQYPVFTFQWKPRYAAERNAKRSRYWVESFKKLAQNADAFIDACDYDVEGSLIGYTILKYACGNKETIAKRMKYSTLTVKELEKAYAELLPHLDFRLIEAGLTRHEVDWLFGINLTRALTIAAKNYSRQYATLSTGRVQGPTLKFLGLRERNIRTFVPIPYWTISAEAEICGHTFEAQYEKEGIETKHEAKAILRACEGKGGIVEKIDVRQFGLAPPLPFDLGTLQSEAYSLFGYAPKRTSDIAQRLYLDALISYPRTSSQKLPASIGFEAILKNLNRTPKFRRLTAELLEKSGLSPREGPREDSAHPAIYPTGEIPRRALDNSERNIWDLIVRRFMAVFAQPATKQSMKVDIDINGNHFHLRGTRILDEGWLRFYGPHARRDEALLPPISKGESVRIKKVVSEDRFTAPAPRYNPSSLLRRMEEAEIGTKATRADIIQTLYNREYVKNERITVTDLGFEVLEILEEYCPTVVSIRLTRKLEEEMNKIQANAEKRERVLKETVETLGPIMQNLKEKENIIGRRLSEAQKKLRLEERIVGSCPICGTGQLVTLRSRKSGKRFVGCTNYFKGLCRAAFPLPQRGSIRPAGRTCHACGWPTVQARMTGRRAWILCLNPQCPLKKEERKKD